MIPIKLFILGFLFGTLGVSILEWAIELLQCFGELLKGKIALKIAMINQYIDALSYIDDEEGKPKLPIDFHFEGEYDDEE